MRSKVIGFPAFFLLLLLSLKGVCPASADEPAVFRGSLVNIPLGSRIYGDIEELESAGLVISGLLSSKPFSRNEGARLVSEAARTGSMAGVGIDISS